MTSSWLLHKRRTTFDQSGNHLWDLRKFSHNNSPLGGWEDHYITPGHTHSCHPDYDSIPIGHPYGFHVCVKRNPSEAPMRKQNIHKYNGYHRFQTSLYDPEKKYPQQDFNPYSFYSRTVPDQEYLHSNDYLARDVHYNGIGANPITTPHSPGEPFRERHFAYDTPSPPPKYDVTRLEQPYTLWKKEQSLTKSQEELDSVDEANAFNIRRTF